MAERWCECRPTGVATAGVCANCGLPVAGSDRPVDRSALTVKGVSAAEVRALADKVRQGGALPPATPGIDRRAKTVMASGSDVASDRTVASAPPSDMTRGEVGGERADAGTTTAGMGTGAVRKYADGRFVTMSGRQVDAAVDTDAAGIFALPYASTDVIKRIGAYDVLAELGRGGMGVVYRAYSLRLCRMVALKMLLVGDRATEADLVRFQNEAMLSARLHHPNIVPVFDAGEHEGNFYFVMGFVKGDGFGAVVDDNSEAAMRRGIGMLAKVARALEHAHSVGIVHRDIKPDNILVDADDEPHITDFGIAKNTHQAISLTGRGDVLGTPVYMAPEQANNELSRIGPLTDVYALGATMYHLLTGKVPFDGPTALSILLNVLEEQPEAPRVVARKNRGRDIGADLDTVCLKAMEKRAADRYPSAAAFADDLEAYLADRPVAARPSGGLERFQKLVRRNRGAFVGALVAFTTLTLMTIGFGVVMSFNIDQTSESLRDNDTRAGLDQALTLERAIITNMAQGRPDVARKLVNALRADKTVTKIEVVRPDKTLAYRDLSTLKTVGSYITTESRAAWIKAKQPGIASAIEASIPTAVRNIQSAKSISAEPLRFDYDDAQWRQVLTTGEQVTRIDDIDGVPHLTVLKPIMNGAACQSCHGPVGAADSDDPYGGGGYDDGYERAGDTSAKPYDPDNKVRAVLVIHRSQAAVEAQISDNKRQTLLVGLATAAGFLVLLYLFTRLFGVRLRPQKFGSR